MNTYLLEYTINYILRYRKKNIFISFILISLTTLLASVLFISTSLKYELNLSVDSMADIVLQNKKAGMNTTLNIEILDEIFEIDGVVDAQSRVWGYYHYDKEDVNFLIFGVNQFEEQYSKTLKKIVSDFDLNSTSMVVGDGVKKLLDRNYYDKYFNFITENSSIKKVYISSVFHKSLDFESNDMMVMNEDLARKVLGFKSFEATDIVIKVVNPKELSMIAFKIKSKYPTYDVTTSSDIRISYENIFDYRSGMFLLLFIVSLFTFFIIIYDKASGLSSEEKKEIGILKALGWKIEDVLYAKFYEGFIVSFFSYMIGIIIAFFYVYILNAPILKYLFIENSNLQVDFNLPFVFDFEVLFLIFLLSVVLYVFATLIPAWRVATQDADEVIR